MASDLRAARPEAAARELVDPASALRSLSRLRGRAIADGFRETYRLTCFASPACGVETSEARSQAGALEERGGWGLSPLGQSRCGTTPTPTLPRKRGRKRNADAAGLWTSYEIALRSRGRAGVGLPPHQDFLLHSDVAVTSTYLSLYIELLRRRFGFARPDAGAVQGETPCRRRCSAWQSPSSLR